MDGKKVTRAELELELNTLLGTAEIRMLDLEEQERFRALIFQNALLIVEGGAFNPLGLITGMAALYGITSATKSTVSAIKKKPPTI